MLSRLDAASGPAAAINVMICVITTTTAVSPNVALRVGPNVDGCAVEDVAEAQRPQRDDSRRQRSANLWWRNAIAGLRGITRCGG